MRDYYKQCREDLVIEQALELAQVELAIVRKQPGDYESLRTEVKRYRSFNKKIDCLSKLDFLKNPINNLLKMYSLGGQQS